jgi:hypothetical protein
MTIRKALLALVTAALMSAPAWAPASATPPGNPGNTHGHGPAAGNEHSGGKGRGNSNPGKSHRCKPHSAAYVASGTLVSQGLTKNADGSYSGTLSIEVKQANHHAASDKGKTVEYKVEGARVTFGLPSSKPGEAAGLEDVKVGDRVKVIGKITVLAKNCPSTGFTPTTTIRRIVFHEPSAAKP